MRLLLTTCFVFFASILLAQHPVAFATAADLSFVKSNLTKYPLLKKSFEETKKSVDAYVGKDVDVPLPKDPAGGYTHERHKENYMLVFNGGILYNLTGDKKYADLVKSILLKYAALNPGLQKHPQATSNSPGHIFWQALNDANWLVYCGLGYDLVENALSPSDKKKIEEGAFKPEVDFVTKDLEPWFNLIHNHGVWACAGVGIVGIATNNNDYVQKALYGTKGDGKSGFLAQLDNLFSPDGYYTEGPYYVRYATLPFFLFANALNNARPELKIFEHRNQILKKALNSGLQQTNIDGKFFPLNDALKDKDYTSNELVSALGIAWNVYGKNEGWLTVAKKQGRVLLSRSGVAIAAAIAGEKNIPEYYPYASVQFTDGAKGDEGGVSYLRAGKDDGLVTLCLKYASHGLSHGHYDELNLFLFNKGKEILQDYGSVRFIGIEQKFGGRYLPENTSYAGQTIAHNTLVVDEASQYGGVEKEASKYHGTMAFGQVGKAAVQVVSAKDDHAYTGVAMQRTLYMLQLPGFEKPLMVDLFQTTSDGTHQYDLPFQYNGQVINASFRYHAFTGTQEAMGKKNGYQFLWKEAEARLHDTLAQFTFLHEDTYYSISSLVQDSATVFFTRTGANDPNFNLRREPSYIIRKKGGSQTFLNVIEIHGRFDPIAELSVNAYPSVQGLRLWRDDADMTIASILVRGKEIVIAQCRKDLSPDAHHRIDNGNLHLSWTGPFVVSYEGQILK